VISDTVSTGPGLGVPPNGGKGGESKKCDGEGGMDEMLMV